MLLTPSYTLSYSKLLNSKTNTLAYVENIMVGPEGPLTPFYTNNNTPIPDFPRTEKDIDEASDDQLDKLASWLEMKPIRGIEKKENCDKEGFRCCTTSPTIRSGKSRRGGLTTLARKSRDGGDVTGDDH